MQTTFAQEQFQNWLAFPQMDPVLYRELISIQDQKDEIEERFYQDLAFGTGGLRGIMGAGTNRMNIYTIQKVTQGYADYLCSNYSSSHVVIAYDSRHGSYEFAVNAARVLAANNIIVSLFPSLRSTPQLSYTISHLQAQGGIMITASHNPKIYNGYKVYDHFGNQLLPEVVDEMLIFINRVKRFSDVHIISQEEAEYIGKLNWVGEQLDIDYVDEVLRQRVVAEEKANKEISIIYTPLHGTGHPTVPNVLRKAGYKNVLVVSEQATPDPNFSTIISPNPEDVSTFDLSINLAKKHPAKLLLATDPDADRMGVMIREKEGAYVALTGNQVGALLAYYLFANKKLPKQAFMVKTIVTSDLGARIAETFGVRVENTLTGFKYIGKRISADPENFVFGYEESCGYLTGTYARDKDAVLACLLVAEMASHYLNLEKTLYDVLQEIYQLYGYYKEAQISFTFEGQSGMKKMQRIMSTLRHTHGFSNIEKVFDYQKGIDQLPIENVLKFISEDGSWFCLRPSGTEPKLKAYFSTFAHNEGAAEKRLDILMQEVHGRIVNVENSEGNQCLKN